MKHVVQPLVTSGWKSSGLLSTKFGRPPLSHGRMRPKPGNGIGLNPLAILNCTPRNRERPSPLLPSSEPWNQPLFCDSMNCSTTSVSSRYRMKSADVPVVGLMVMLEPLQLAPPFAFTICTESVPYLLLTPGNQLCISA